MKCIPRYTVCYRDGYHAAGEAFEIEPGDALEMAQHGEIVTEAEKQEKPETESPAPRKRGRARA